ncbi:MAG: hypothetical protein E7299_03515 [Lachnospiraceae bacterium]|nr:hypothetical protein [Lachnospiraceae bacterium]
MRRKLLMMVVICLIVITSMGSATASTIEPRYNEITSVNTTISADNGSILFDVLLYVPSTTTLDSAWIDIEVRNLAGTVVGTFTGKKMTKGSLYFYYENTCDISTSGTYFFSYEIRCYKNAILVDNPTGTSEVVSYTA